MTLIRSTIFNIFFLTWTFLITFLSLPSLVFPKSISLSLAKIWANVCLLALKYIIGVNFYLEGFEMLPSTPFIIASKHQSALETIILVKKLKNPVFILKNQLLHIPLFGLFLRKLGMIAVRKKNMLKNLFPQVEKVLSNNQQLIIFPEGSRTIPGHTVKYRKGIERIHENFPKIPIYPIALNTGQIWPKRSFFKYSGICHLKILPPVKTNTGEIFLEKLKNSIEKKSLNFLDSNAFPTKS